MLTRISFVAAAALALSASGVQAQGYDSYNNWCYVGALRPCASVQVWTLNEGAAGTDVRLWARNLQGTLVTDNTGGSVLTAIGITAPNTVGTASGLSTGTSGSVGVAGSPAPLWAFTAGTIGGNPTELRIGSGIEGGILGCDDAAGPPTNYFRTCDSMGYTGWVTFDFHMTGDFTATDLDLAWKFQSVGPNGTSLECRTAGDNQDHLCEVVPEPFTVALLASGLAGMGGAGLLRRRRGLDVKNG
jgi:hypothetical protein